MFTIASLEVSSGQQAVAQHEHSPASSIPEGANSVRVTFSPDSEVELQYRLISCGILY